jgi:hypothetical protein|eukprot:COSAG01_NODE_512_length_16051_cov_33.887161_22_plen_342_part_00
MANHGRSVEEKLELCIGENESLERENALFTAFMDRQSLGKGDEHTMANEQVQPHARRKVVDEKVSACVPIEQRTEVAQQEVEDLKEDINATREHSAKLLDRLLAIMEECTMRTAQVKKDVYEFRREVVIGGENPRTGKIVAEKVIRYFEEKLRQNDSVVDKLKLKNQALKIQIQKLDKQLGEKEEMGQALSAIDFDQLRIENQQYVEKINVRQKELVKLKQTAGKTVHVLNSLKEKLTALTRHSAALELQTAERGQQLAMVKDEICRVQEERSHAQRENRNARQAETEIKMPHIMDYVHRRVNEDEARRQCESWQRKAEIAKRGAIQARRHLYPVPQMDPK